MQFVLDLATFDNASNKLLNFSILTSPPTVSNFISRISSLQNRAVRIMSFADYHAPVDQLYQD